MSGASLFSSLPADLQYLVPPAEKYGRYPFPTNILDFLEQATAEELGELTRLANRIFERKDYQRISPILDQYPPEEFQESAQLRSLFNVMNSAGLQFDAA